MHPMHGHHAPQIPPDFLVNAWLDAHFIHPTETNPLTRGLTPELTDPHKSTSAPKTTSDVTPASLSSDSYDRPSKRQRLTSDCTNAPRSHGQGRGEIAGDRGRQASVDTAENSKSPARGVGAGGGMLNQPSPSIVEDRGRTDGTVNPQPFVGPKRNRDDHGGESSAAHVATYASFTGSLNTSAPSTSGSRKYNSSLKSNSSSPFKAPPSSPDIRRKRRALRLNNPPGTFGIPDLADYSTKDDVPTSIPSHVLSILQRFSPSNFELACVPQTPEIDALLTKFFPHERIPPHARLQVVGDDEPLHALNLVKFAIETHRACLRNSRHAEDKAAWYPLVHALLSINPPSSSTSNIAVPPHSFLTYQPTINNLFLTIDATMKPTASNIPPAANVKLDALLAFNPENRMCSATADNALRTNATLNAFTDPNLATTIIILAVAIHTGSAMEAEYRLGVWGMKTLNLMRTLSRGSEESTPRHTALSVSVCGHVWSLYVSYWRDGGIVTHGPVVVGATDSLYGTLKVVAFVRAVKAWAREELWGDWERVLGVRAERGGARR